MNKRQLLLTAVGYNNMQIPSGDIIRVARVLFNRQYIIIPRTSASAFITPYKDHEYMGPASYNYKLYFHIR